MGDYRACALEAVFSIKKICLEHCYEPLLVKEGIILGLLEDKKTTPENTLDKKYSGLSDSSSLSLLEDKEATRENALDKKDSGLPGPRLSLRDRANVPNYSLKGYLKGDSLVDVIFGTPVSRSTLLVRKASRGDRGSFMDHPDDFWLEGIATSN
jgi:hypothetical protein